ncbi:unnamed protein product, partial [Bubo scandiacus]
SLILLASWAWCWRRWAWRRTFFKAWVFLLWVLMNLPSGCCKGRHVQLGELAFGTE